MTMLAELRRDKILDLIRFERTIGVKELSERLGVTTETIRRDLKQLEEEKQLKRVHGGATLRQTNTDLSVTEREMINPQEKEMIAKEAVKLIDEGDTIFLDASTTVLFMARYLKKLNKGINVITNSIVIVNELKDVDEIKIVSTGGTLRRTGLSFVGPIALKNLRDLHADKFFLSCRGVDIKQGLTDYSESTSYVKYAMNELSTETICLADSSKFGIKSFVKIMDLDEIDYIITDSKIDDNFKKSVSDTKVKMIIVDAANE